MRLASVSRAADHADVHPETIRRRLADGTLTSYRLGRLHRVDLDELDALLRSPAPTRVPDETRAALARGRASIARTRQGHLGEPASSGGVR